MLRRIILLFVLILASGCGGDDGAGLVGAWKGSPVLGKPGAELTFESDHKFRLLFGDLDARGAWSRSGSTVMVAMDTINGKNNAEVVASAQEHKRDPKQAAVLFKPISLTMSEDGKTLIAEEPGTRTVYTKQ